VDLLQAAWVITSIDRPERPGGRPCGVISFLGHDHVHSRTNTVTGG